MTKKAQKNIKEKAVKAALALAAEQDWQDITMADIAKKAKIPQKEQNEHFINKCEILSAYGRMVDTKVIDAVGGPDDSLTPRDRLFEVIMERLDVLNEDRAAVRAILKSFCHDPKQGVIGLPWLGYSMSVMLDTAGIDTGGYRGALKVMGLTGLYLKTLRVWKEDDSPDMAKTMAALDKYLGRAESLASRMGLTDAI